MFLVTFIHVCVCVCVCVCCLPRQELPLVLVWYPSAHTHLYEPSVFTHSPRGKQNSPSKHSLTSVGMQC